MSRVDIRNCYTIVYDELAKLNKNIEVAHADVKLQQDLPPNLQKCNLATTQCSLGIHRLDLSIVNKERFLCRTISLKIKLHISDLKLDPALSTMICGNKSVDLVQCVYISFAN